MARTLPKPLPTILDVAERYGVELQWNGRNGYKALCPFHQETHPSFGVTADGRAFYCFGCGKGGGVLEFIAECEGIPVAAVRQRFQRGRSERSIDDLKKFLHRRGRQKQDDVSAYVRALIATLNARTNRAWTRFQPIRDEMLKARSQGVYNENFHRCLAKNELWEEFWDEYEEAVGAMVWIAKGHGTIEQARAWLRYILSQFAVVENEL